MNKTSVNPVSSVRPADAGGPASTQYSFRPETGEPLSVEKERSVKPAGLDIDQHVNLKNVSIHFRVDDETGQLTVFLVDRASRRVLRSIPASELHKLQAGDLLKLTA